MCSFHLFIYVSTSQTKDVATKSTNDNEDTHYNRAPNDNEQRTKATTGKSDFLASSYW
jgi:hypothetical protein